MSKEVQVVSWCDGDHEQREPAVVERREPFDGEPVVLDLCDPCNRAYEALKEQMKGWLGRGVPVSRAQSATPPSLGKGRASPGSDGNPEWRRTCREPGCDYGVAPTRSALGQHVKSRHGKGISDYDWSSPNP